LPQNPGQTLTISRRTLRAFAAYRSGRGEGLAVQLQGGEFRGLSVLDGKYPGTLAKLIATGPEALHDATATLAGGPVLDPARCCSCRAARSGQDRLRRPQLRRSSLESGFTPANYPTIFARFSSSLIGHGAPILRPAASVQLRL